jgi:hypothetical protein
MGCLVERFGPSSSISFLLAFVFLIFRRYNVQAAVLFSWKDLEGDSQVGEGTTRDIGTQAAFVRYLGGCDANRLEQIRALNPGLDDPDHVQAGQRIRRPGTASRARQQHSKA